LTLKNFKKLRNGFMSGTKQKGARLGVNTPPRTQIANEEKKGGFTLQGGKNDQSQPRGVGKLNGQGLPK